jgi:two-component sensor histidine kinase
MTTDKLRSFARTILTSPRRSIASDFGLAALFFLVAALGRLAVDFSFAKGLPYITFFPLLVLTAALCSLPASMAYVLASAITGSFWMHTTSSRVEAIVLYSIAAALIVALTEGLKDAYRQLKAREQDLTVINAELAHRMRNLLQIANAIVSRSLESSANPKDLKTALTGRLSALSNAQSLITLAPGAVSLSEVVKVTLAPLAPARDRLIANGPRVLLPTKVITMLSLVLYELGTNAVKHGAWSDSKGIVSLVWREHHKEVTLEWEERDGPSIHRSDKLGAGSRLIQTAIPNAAVAYHLDEDGARCRINLPLEPQGS